MQPKALQRSVIALAVAAAFAIGVGVADHVGFSATAANAPAPAVAPTPLSQAPSAVPAAALPDFSGLVERYGPAVVNISVVSGTKTSARMPRMQMPDGGLTVRGQGIVNARLDALVGEFSA